MSENLKNKPVKKKSKNPKPEDPVPLPENKGKKPPPEKIVTSIGPITDLKKKIPKKHGKEKSNFRKKIFQFINDFEIKFEKGVQIKFDKNDKKEKKPKEKGKEKNEKEKEKEKKKDKSADKTKKKKKSAALNKAPNALDEVVKWANKTLDKGVKTLQDEFNVLKQWQPENNDATVFAAPKNMDKNRYKDIPCLEISRVKLKNDAYIHANFVNTPYSQKRFICTQGPLDNTCTAFWQMIVEEECEAILMLCNVVECNQKKCAEYYPQKVGQIVAFGEFTIKATKQYLQPDDQSIEIICLGVRYPGCQKTLVVKHFRWIDWPDKGVPQINLTPTNMLSSVRGSKKPIVVHCSAGIGRTGTIVLIEYILEKMLSGQNCEDTYEILKDLRRQRAQSVQTDMQYVFVHRFLLHYFIERKSIEMSQRYLEFTDDYDMMLKKFIEMEVEKRKKKEAAAKDNAAATADQPPPPSSPMVMMVAVVDQQAAPLIPPQQHQQNVDPFFSVPDSKIQGVTTFGAAPESTVALQPDQNQQPK